MRRLSISSLVLFLTLGIADAQDSTWKPVTPAELAAAPSIDPAADAEVLFWDLRVEQSESKTIVSHYIRIKIFTDRAVDTQGRVDLPYGGKNSIKDIAARTIQADGTINDLKPDAIFERTIVKGKKVKVRAKSFALPNVKPGVVIDYRWTEVLQDVDPFHQPFFVQRDIPVRVVQFNIKPISGIPWPLRITGFNVQMTPVTPDRLRVETRSSAPIPAFHEEPAMPPEAAVRSWVFVYYDVPNFWDQLGTYTYEAIKSRMKVTDEIRREAAKLVANASTDEEKIKRIYDFCRTEIRRTDDDASDDSVQRAADLSKENKIPADTLKRKAGTARDIDFLFAALAIGAGFDARYALAEDRSLFLFDDRYPTPYMLASYNIGVRLNQKWHFFDPAGRYLSLGMLRWQEEGVRALLVSADGGQFVTTDFSPAERSLLKRTLTGRLDPDGALEGDVRLIFFGHTGAEEKELMDGLSQNEREEYFKNQIKRRMSSAEVSNIQIQNVLNREEPIIESYHVRIPDYAQRIGRRLFIEPGYFQHGRAPMFSAGTRTHGVYIPYPWTEDDMVLIDLPAGFALDNADQPPAAAAAGETARHEMHIAVMDGNKLRYSRHFSFANNRKIIFPVSDYPYIKSVFDAIEKRDSHTIAIRQGATEEEKR